MNTAAPTITPGLSAVFIHVTDLARAAAFYSGLFGRSVGDGEDCGNGIFILRLASGVDLLLDANHPEGRQAPTASPMHATCMFGADDIDAAHALMRARGIETVTDVHRSPAASWFNFRDPDGNVQMVCQQHR